MSVTLALQVESRLGAAHTRVNHKHVPRQNKERNKQEPAMRPASFVPRTLKPAVQRGRPLSAQKQTGLGHKGSAHFLLCPCPVLQAYTMLVAAGVFCKIGHLLQANSWRESCLELILV